MKLRQDGQHPFFASCSVNYRVVKKVISCLGGQPLNINKLFTFLPFRDETILFEQMNQALLFFKKSHICEGKSLVAKFIQDNFNKPFPKPRGCF